MLQRYKKLTEEVLHKNPWWKYKHDTYELPSGKVGEYYYAETPGCVFIVPILPDGRIMLTVQYRYLTDKQSIEFPAGGIMEGESPIEAAKRELFEETGYVAKNFIKIGEFEPANGLVLDRAHVFLAKVTEQHNVEQPEEEKLEIIYRRPDEIDEMLRQNTLGDGMTITSWAMVRHHFFEDKPKQEKPGFYAIIDQLLSID